MAHLHETYELYLTLESEESAFEALTCASPVELVGRVRDIMRERVAKSVEVQQAGRTLFTMFA